MDTPAPRRCNTQLITRAMIRELRERIAANPPNWLRPALDAARTRTMQVLPQTADDETAQQD